MGITFLIIDLIIVVSLLVLSGISLSGGGYKKYTNRLFSVFSLVIALWIFSSYMGGDVTSSKEVALISNYFAFASALASVTLLTYFIFKLIETDNFKKIVKYSLIPLSFLCLICFSPLIVSDIKLQDMTYAVVSGPLMNLYLAGLLFNFAIIAYSMIFGLRNSVGNKKRQLVAIGIGLLISLPSIILLDFIIPMATGLFYLSEFGITPMIFLVISIYYGVVKYRLFDIRLAAARTVAYVLSLIVLSLIYYYFAYIASYIFFRGNINSSVSISPMNIALALILAFAFQPIKKTFDRMTNAIFYKDNYNSDLFFSRINQIATQTSDMGVLLRNSANEIEKTIKVEQVFFTVLKNDGDLISAGTNHHSRLPLSDVSMLNGLINEGVQLLDRHFLLNNDGSDLARRLMVSHRLELILPLIVSDGLIGFLCLGDKKISNYSSRDVSVLITASNELAIAIQNALAVQEIREFNTTLQQRVANATRDLRASNAQLQRLDKAKDEFVSMASHQLRTPLTTVKGYISMVMDGDAGEITKEQSNLLNEAFLSSERMVHLVNDFLNVSRIQTGKFLIDKHSTDLSILVEQEIDRLRASAKSRNMEFIFERPTGFPMMDIDDGKIREVVMNFADNAIYYSHEGSKITVSLSNVDGNAVFKVKDSGIGVPIEEQSRLFTKFYRASNAKRQRPDGTGVGLFLAKKVITAHGGKVVFETVHDEGSTFGFSLPIELSAKPG